MQTVQVNLDQLRYPIGKFSRPAFISPADISKWIDEIEALPKQLRKAVEPLNDSQLATPILLKKYFPGAYSPTSIFRT